MEPPSSYSIHILNETSGRLPVKAMRAAIEAALDQYAAPEGEVNVLVTDDATIQSLNLQFRGIDSPTDVLTFPGDEEPDSPLGEIAISLPYAKRQAIVRGVSLTQEICFLAIHGALHICGFDDESEPDRIAMVDAMNVVAVRAGLKPDLEWSSILHGDAA